MSAAEQLAKQMAKQFGGSDSTIDDNPSWLNSGISDLNKIVSGSSGKGFPQGRIIEIFGDPSCGKTALATMLMIAAQKQGGCAIFIDWERSFMVGYAEKLGLNSNSPYFYYKKPKTWEEGNTVALQMAQMIRDSGLLDKDAPIVIVFDSVASAVPKSVFEKGIDELTMNDTSALSRVTSTTLKSIASIIDDLGATAIYLNQTRQKIGVMFGDPTTTPGGKAMEFYASVRLSLGKKLVKDSKTKEVIAHEIKAKTVKNKLTRPHQETTWRIVFEENGGVHFDVAGALIDTLDKQGKLEKAGNYFVFDEKKMYRNAFITYVEKNDLIPKLEAMFESE